MKKEWKKPMLNILTRGKSEESVLVTCKFEPAGETSNNATCRELDPGCVPCSVIAET
ncbi:MAG: hypothetical protein HQ564_07425 [Candidatus Saganbacteria bacterium]|nr:hypothetical protein [Candidatus Saganbacteria bacterium]